jgi:hypothetical protein
MILLGVAGSMLGGRTRERIPKVPSTAATKAQSPLAGLDAPAPRLSSHRPGSEAWERDQLIDRLRSLRRVLPVLAQEMASARRQAARLTVDNRRLSEQVRELRTELESRTSKAA